jgi:hypothetical protein
MNLNRNGANLCQKVRDNVQLTHAGHSEQDAVLRYELRTGVFKDLERGSSGTCGTARSFKR